MMSSRILALLQELANQQAFLYNLTPAKVKGCETLNVVLPTMGNIKYFIQLNHPTPCISPVGLESDDKR